LLMIAIVFAFFEYSLAQNQIQLKEGDVLRITSMKQDFRKLKTTFISMGEKSIQLKTDTELTLPRNDLDQVEVYLGKKRRAGKGAWIGGIAGSALSITSIAILRNTLDELYSADISYPLWGLAGGAAGAGLGALIGVFIKTDHWQKLDIGKLQMSLIPESQGRIGLGIALDF